MRPPEGWSALHGGPGISRLIDIVPRRDEANQRESDVESTRAERKKMVP